MGTPYDQQKENFGPLTTVFTPPTSCLSTTSYMPDSWGFFYVGAAFTMDVYQCYPSGTRDLNMHTPYFYSPGICPSGWNPVIQMETDFPSTTISTDTISKETTAWLCCPSGFQASNLVTSWLWYYTQDCVKTIQASEMVTNVWATTDGEGSVADVEVKSKILVSARGIPIFWESTDQAVLDWWKTASPIPVSTTASSKSASRTLTPPYTKISDSASSTVPNGSDASSTASGGPPAQQDTTGGRGLSIGAQTGIGVGVGIAVILIAAVTYLMFRLRRTRSQMELMQRQLGPHEVPYNPGGIEKPTSANVPEMGTPANFHELDPENQPDGHQREGHQQVVYKQRGNQQTG